MARFTAAEARLYPLALADPDGYERVASLVGLVADELRRTAADIATVLEHREELIGRVPQLAADAGLDPDGLPLDAVVDAASHSLPRAAGDRPPDRQSVVEAARGIGGGVADGGGGPGRASWAGTYRRVETHVPTGTDAGRIVDAESGGGQRRPDLHDRDRFPALTGRRRGPALSGGPTPIATPGPRPAADSAAIARTAP